MHGQSELRQIRAMLWIVVAGLVISGVTAFPLTWEVGLLVRWLEGVSWARGIGVLSWLQRVHAGLAENDVRYPFIAYGTDWLAFAHLAIAFAFWGPIREPVRNKWVVAWGCGVVRGCWFWRSCAGACGEFRGDGRWSTVRLGSWGWCRCGWPGKGSGGWSQGRKKPALEGRAFGGAPWRLHSPVEGRRYF